MSVPATLFRSRYHIALTVLLLQLGLLGLSPSAWLLHSGNIVATVILAWAGSRFAGRPREFFILLALGVLAPVIDLIEPWAVAPAAVNITKEILWLAFPAYLAYLIFEAVFTADEITHEEISGVIAVYLLIGLFFANVYEFFAIFDPGAIAWGPTFGAIPTFGDYVYFSFVTMATVGYGDASPANSLARVAVVIQAVIGLMYIAVLIARFVGEHSRSIQSRTRVAPDPITDDEMQDSDRDFGL